MKEAFCRDGDFSVFSWESPDVFAISVGPVERAFEVFGYLLMCVGIACGIIGTVFWVIPSTAPSPAIEMPLGGLSGIAVDSDGYIYCYLPSYNRIQQYDRHGRFVRGWQCRGIMGGLIRVTENDDIELGWNTGRIVQRFNSHGDLLKENIDPVEENGDFTAESRRTCLDKSGRQYLIRGVFFREVRKVTDEGAEETLIATAWYKSILAPGPGLFFGFLGVLIVSSLNKKRKAQIILYSDKGRKSPEETEPTTEATRQLRDVRQ